MDEAKKHFDTSMLPKEYGGTMPMSEMIGKSLIFSLLYVMIVE